MTNLISLTDAAKRLSLSWERAWRALLSGNLEGEKRDGRWYVTECSVRRYKQSLSAATLSPGGGSATDETSG